MLYGYSLYLLLLFFNNNRTAIVSGVIKETGIYFHMMVIITDL